MAMKKLGRGLDALLGDFTATPPEGVVQADIYMIDTNADQPRKTFDEERLNELAESLKRHGMVQPIIVHQNGERYTIVAGERRFRAARLAGFQTVPVIVKQFDDAEIQEIALVENLQRESLNPIEEAHAYKRLMIEEAAAIRFLMQQHDLTQEEVSSRLSKSRPAIANSLRLLSLPDSVQDMVKEGKLSAGHGRALAAIKDEAAVRRLAGDAAINGWSVREIERKATKFTNPELDKVERESKKKRVRQTNDMYVAQEKLREHLGTKVTIDGSEKKGKITIEYYTRDGLEALYDALMKL